MRGQAAWQRNAKHLLRIHACLEAKVFGGSCLDKKFAWGSKMGGVVWPVEIRTEGSAANWCGRVLHWLLTALAFAVLALSAVTAGTVLLGADWDDGLWPGSAGWMSAMSSLAGVAVFWFGRLLRFMLARE